MKKLWIIPLLALLLCGCGGEETRETVNDIQQVQTVATMRRVIVQLPEELSTPALQDEKNGKLYLCENYSVTMQTVAAGDLDQTIRNATGKNRENLQIMETKQDDVTRYQWVWTTGGENGVQVGRGCILDDGNYHYVLTALVDESQTETVQTSWQSMFRSFRLASDGEVSTGS